MIGQGRLIGGVLAGFGVVIAAILAIYAFANAGNDRFFRRPADEPFELGTHGHAGLASQLNAVAADSVEELPAL